MNSKIIEFTLKLGDVWGTTRFVNEKGYGVLCEEFVLRDLGYKSQWGTVKKIKVSAYKRRSTTGCSKVSVIDKEFCLTKQKHAMYYGFAPSNIRDRNVAILDSLRRIWKHAGSPKVFYYKIEKLD